MMSKKYITHITILGFLMQSTGVSYALRPTATARSGVEDGFAGGVRVKTEPIKQITQIPKGLSELETALEVDKIILSLTLEQQAELKTKLDLYLKDADERQHHLAEICLEEIRIVGLLKDVPSIEPLAYKHLPRREIPYQWAKHSAPAKYISGTLNYGFFNVISGWKTFWATGPRTPADLQQSGPRDVTFTYAVPKLLEWLYEQGSIYFLRDSARVAHLPPALRQEIVKEVAEEEARGVWPQRRKKLLNAEDAPDKKG
jgi:hypothetical protein